MSGCGTTNSRRYRAMITMAVGTIVFGCAVHRKMLFKTVELRCTTTSEDTVLCSTLTITTDATLHTAITTMLMRILRDTPGSSDRNHATSGASGSSVTALVFDRQAKRN